MTPDGEKRLMLDEGLKLKPYWDGTGAYLQAGSQGIPTIAFGRNLAGKGISFSEAKLMLQNDLADGLHAVLAAMPSVGSIPDVWADVLQMIHYNTGNIASWPHLLLAMRNGSTAMAVSEIQNSKAFKGVQYNRYQRFCNAVLYRRWLFSSAEEAAYTKMLASG